MLRTVTVTRYVTPLREGGSLPGLMEADDLGTYVVKFTGAGQGRKALVAEVICAGLARALCLPVPDLVCADVDPVLAANEPDEEVQDLLRRSPGLNLGVDYLPGALDFDAGAFAVDAEFAGRVLWFDALIGNVDRSWRNPNILFWHNAAYLIDHGAALTFQHNWTTPDPGRPYDAREHALLGCAPDVAAADASFAPLVTRQVLESAVADVPIDWVPDDDKARYVDTLLARVAAHEQWVRALSDTVLAHGTGVRVAPKRNRPTWLGGST